MRHIEGPLAAEFDNGIATKAAFGVVVLEKDETLEPELGAALEGDGVGLYHSRIPSDEQITPDTLKAMATEIPRALKLLPVARPLDVVAYACTSASTMIGQAEIAAMIKDVHPAAKATNPITSVIAACRRLGIKRLGLLTPYRLDVSAAMRRLLEEAGLTVQVFASFEETSDPRVARISPRSVLEGIRQVGGDTDVDGVFASCTNLRTFEILEAAEADIGKPVISSNAALAWHMRMLAGLRPGQQGPGQLLRSAAV